MIRDVMMNVDPSDEHKSVLANSTRKNVQLKG
jgi:hypothetical protein